jgi:ankyrin repeat protein
MTGTTWAPALALLLLLSWPEAALAQTSGETSPKASASVADRALLEAAQRDDPELADFALAKGARLEALDPDGNTPLIVAAAGKSRRLVTLLLERGADPAGPRSTRPPPAATTGSRSC